MRFWGCVVLLFSICTVLAQEKPEICFVQTTYHFPVCSEDDGVQNGVFTFQNRGKVPLLIYGIETSCGCTVAGYAREPVPPGGKGRITIAFYPEGRPGKFLKTIRVKSNAIHPETLLKISGEVTPTRQSYPAYRYRVGNLKLKSLECRLGEMRLSQPYEERIAVVNAGTAPVKVEFKTNLPGFSCFAESDTIQPQGMCDFVMTGVWKQELAPGKYIEPIEFRVTDLESGTSVSSRLTLAWEISFDAAKH